jgi:putative transposase
LFSILLLIGIDKAYKDELDADVRERILLVRRVLSDKQHVESVAQELHKLRSWAYKWYKRHTDEGLDGLKDKPRSGKPSIISK